MGFIASFTSESGVATNRNIISTGLSLRHFSRKLETTYENALCEERGRLILLHRILPTQSRTASEGKQSSGQYTTDCLKRRAV